MLDTKVTEGRTEVTVGVASMDASNADQLKTAFKAFNPEDTGTIVLNLEKVGFIDSSGIGVILSFYKQVNQALILSKPSPTVMSVLELLRLHRVFEIEQV
jgi:anti-sigma B factor antagonist